MFDLESRVARLEEIVSSLVQIVQILIHKSETDLKHERDIAQQEIELTKRRFKLLDDIIIRIEVLEEAISPPDIE